MIITSHLLGTVVLARILSIEFPELYVALVSGVAIDVDHFFVNKKWIKDVRDFLKERRITYGIIQHSWFQELVFGVAAGSIGGFVISHFWPFMRWWVFPLFLFLHIVMDSVMSFEHRPLAPFKKYRYWGWLRQGTKAELVISLAGLVVIFLL